LEMLPGTIAENIARFDPAAKDHEIIEAAEIAGVHEMILALPGGYGTQIGTVAQPLSGGQIQRLGLARAIFRQPRLIVLDEPNSNLDGRGDDALAAAIQALRERGSVVVVMAHRPIAIAAVNKVMILHKGAVVHFGEKEEVFRLAMRSANAPARRKAGPGHGRPQDRTPRRRRGRAEDRPRGPGALWRRGEPLAADHRLLLAEDDHDRRGDHHPRPGCGARQA